MATISPNKPMDRDVLAKNPEQIALMEMDLQSKANAALKAAGFTPGPDFQIYGVFSLDDLENRVASTLCNGVSIGVGYVGATPSEVPASPNASPGTPARQVINLRFVITVMVPPIADDCKGRYHGTKMLALLRRHILGSAVESEHASRVWTFVSERPEIEASTQQLLIYSQVWQLTLIQPSSPRL